MHDECPQFPFVGSESVSGKVSHMEYLPMTLAPVLVIGMSVNVQADGEVALYYYCARSLTFSQSQQPTGADQCQSSGSSHLVGGPAALCNEAQWKQATASAEQVAVGQHGLALQQAPQGNWTSKWLDAPEGDCWKSVAVEAETDLFANKTIEVVIDGSTKPFVDADGVEHDWYGRCMIAILDVQRWALAIRSGINHIQIGKRDAIHVLTSNDEGRTWSKLNHWFDGTPIEGLPYEDGHNYSEPGLYRMPNGDLILQFK